MSRLGLRVLGFRVVSCGFRVENTHFGGLRDGGRESGDVKVVYPERHVLFQGE